MVNVSKIRQLESTLGSGARTNKYRVLFPYFGKEINIQTHAMSSPGSSMGVAEVYIKGRKFQVAGDRADEGVITMTFYNDPELIIRRFFLQIIDGIQNFNTPITIENGSAFSSFGNDVTNSSPSYSFAGRSISNRILSAYDEIRRNFDSIASVFRNAGSYLTGEKILFNNARSGVAPWYQSDIIIQQLDHNGEITSETILHNAFVTDVSPVDYTDEVGEISTTTISLAYTGADFEATNTRIGLDRF